MWLPFDEDWDTHWALDPKPPAVLFARGDRSLLAKLRVGIVGTRSATPAGRAMAERFGRELGDFGCAVVSGLAYGIDASAHAGTLTGADPAPIGVVGSGLDVIYPRQNAELWKRVSDMGLMLSEYPPGTRPTAQSFPARNRLIAALSNVVVVVESAESGGSLITCEEAWARKRPVMTVPGSPLNPSCVGSNLLLRKVFSSEYPIIPCVDTSDILSVLQLEHAMSSIAPDPRQPPSGLAIEVLQEMGWDPITTAKLVLRFGKTPSEIAAALGQLEDDEWVQCRQGQWHQIPPNVGRRGVGKVGKVGSVGKVGKVASVGNVGKVDSVRSVGNVGSSARPQRLPLDMVGA